MASKKTYWKQIEQLNPQNTEVQKLAHDEFASKLPKDFLSDEKTLQESNTSRRDFLKYVGFSTAAASLAACEGPVIKSVPYVVQPEQIRPGVANYYATAIADGFDFASILVKTREGRPIKIENNADAPTLGGANARVHASVLSLYDINRLQGPKANGTEVSWEDLHLQVGAKLKALAASGKKVALITQTFSSPTTEKIIADFISTYPNVEHAYFDTVASADAVDAFEATYGLRALADYDFSKANTIVSIGADFLGDWQGGGYDSGYSKTRIPHKDHGQAKMSQHFQFEANMTLSGAAADYRIPATPSAQKNILVHLYAKLVGATVSGSLSEAHENALNKAVSALKKAANKAVVVSGIQDVGAQKLVLAINRYLASDVMDVAAPRLIRKENGAELDPVIKGIKEGTYGGAIFVGVNPVYSMPDGEAFAEGIKKLDLSVSFAMKEDDTAVACQYIAATPHYLEGWGDYEFKKGHFALAQPTIRPLFDTLQFQDVLLQWAGSNANFYESIQQHWKENILVDKAWSAALHDGFYSTAQTSEVNPAETDLTAALQSLAAASSKGMELVLYTKTGMGDGNQANNPWLQEFPDPISRTSWDNYLTISAADAKALGLKNVNVANGALNGSYASVSVGDQTLKVPVLIQPGQAIGSVGLALGYGKRLGLQEEMQVGVNAYCFYNSAKEVQEVTIAAAEGYHEFACVQLHNTLMGRDIVKETTLEIFNTKDKDYWNPIPKVSKNHIETPVTSPEVDIWENFDRSIGHHFNLSIDLNACTGCGACVIACHSENNVPVVGKQEIRKSRDMHWLRIDRYYSSETSFEGDKETADNISGLGDSLTTFGEMEQASENPQVTFQPVMCQHCNHAPCETVCPVAATSHGRQGQNHMAYNRCVGTRYCANNCPYKVRRFNWFLYNKNDEFDYHMNNDLGRMVLNPDVVVRSRGVMEKCSMCIQKTQKTILDAKLEGRAIKDGEFQTACSAACSNGAMVFGDINDKDSQVAALKENDRMYHLLESVGTKPNVMYQTKVRNV